MPVIPYPMFFTKRLLSQTNTESEVNRNYFYIVYRQTIWTVKTDALSLILYWVSVIVSCLLTLHDNICDFQFLFGFNFTSTSEIYHSHLSCLVHWLEQNYLIAELLSTFLRSEQARQQMCSNTSEFEYGFLEGMKLNYIWLWNRFL